MLERSSKTIVVSLPDLLRVAAMSSEVRASAVEAQVALEDALHRGDWQTAKTVSGTLRDLEGWVITLQETLRTCLRVAGRG